LAQHKRLGTLRSYLSDAKAILSVHPDLLVWEMGEAERERVAEFDLLEHPAHRRMSAWRSWRAYLQQVGLPVAALDARNPRCEKRTVEEIVFTPSDVAALMLALREIGTPAAHAAFVILPIAFHGMLRIDEALHLRICDMALNETVPYLDIRNAKGGKARRVFLVDMPAQVLQFIKDVRADRVAALRKQYPTQAAEAVYVQRLLDPVVVDASSLEKVFKRVVRQIGLGDCTFHDLRKGGANWHYVHGRDVRLIARWLGHGAPGVTYLSYLRTVDLWQRKGANKLRCDMTFSRAKMAALLNISDSTYVSRLVQAQLTQLGIWRDGQVGCSVTQARAILQAATGSQSLQGDDHDHVKHYRQ
jgi:integrase